uniref:HTH psq-type domain-containing protein n=1 Tax=Trichogramma kaykai TaxID=54128 RepID=A0ABD2VTH3_9HYME
MANALSAIKKGVVLRAASVAYEVPYSTLNDKRDGKSQIGAKSGGKSVLSMEEENLPGRHWLDAFMKRHSSELAARVPQNLSQRRTDVTEVKLRAWFQEVELHLKNKNVQDVDGNRVFNCYETAALLNP